MPEEQIMNGLRNGEFLASWVTNCCSLTIEGASWLQFLDFWEAISKCSFPKPRCKIEHEENLKIKRKKLCQNAWIPVLGVYFVSSEHSFESTLSRTSCRSSGKERIIKNITTVFNKNCLPKGAKMYASTMSKAFFSATSSFRNSEFRSAHIECSSSLLEFREQ